MTFTKGHKLWKHPNSVKTQFKKGVKPREYTRKPCVHGIGYWFCDDCQREYKRVRQLNVNKDERERKNAHTRAKYWIEKEDPEKMKAKREYQNIWYKGPKGVYKVYRRNAKNRGLDFNFSFGEFIELWEAPCHYCGGSPRTGIDRVDSKKGYSKENVVPCCRICNWMKSNLSQKEFMEHCRRIVAFFGTVDKSGQAV